MNPVILARWHDRLENWAAWCVSGSGRHSPGVSGIYRGENRFRAEYVGPRPLIGDASDVDRLVHKLSCEHQDALKAAFIWTGSWLDRARSLGCHADTLRNRMHAAIGRLDDLEQARRQVAR